MQYLLFCSGYQSLLRLQQRTLQPSALPKRHCSLLHLLVGLALNAFLGGEVSRLSRKGQFEGLFSHTSLHAHLLPAQRRLMLTRLLAAQLYQLLGRFAGRLHLRCALLCKRVLEVAQQRLPAREVFVQSLVFCVLRIVSKGLLARLPSRRQLVKVPTDCLRALVPETKFQRSCDIFLFSNYFQVLSIILSDFLNTSRHTIPC